PADLSGATAPAVGGMRRPFVERGSDRVHSRMVKKLKSRWANTGKRSRPISRNRFITGFSPNGVLAWTT
ncbi:MAG: hypothetical protein QNL45_03550, partial [Nitrospirota bacterium]|nr:hypothetical protein [Nitrospirota bacterium]